MGAPRGARMRFLIVNPLLQTVLSHATSRGVFSKIESLPDRLRCHAKACPEPAWY